MREEDHTNEGTETSPAPQVHSVSCSNCGAPLSYIEGESVITCEYCGTTTMLTEHGNIVTVESHYLLTPEISRDEALGIASGWLGSGFYHSKKLPSQLKWRKTEPIVLPYWVVRCKAETVWRGQNKKTKTVGSGDSKRKETYWEPVSGNFSESYTWPIYAREDENEFWGIRSIEPGRTCIFPNWGKFILRLGGSGKTKNRDLLKESSQFSIEKLRDTGMEENIVNGQIRQERAERLARDRIMQKHSQKSENKATEITDCDTAVKVDGVDLVYMPLWEISYASNEKIYNVLVDGSEARVLSAEYPVGKWTKAIIVDVLAFVLMVIFLLVGKTQDLETASNLPWFLAAASGAIGIFYSAVTAFFAK